MLDANNKKLRQIHNKAEDKEVKNQRQTPTRRKEENGGQAGTRTQRWHDSTTSNSRVTCSNAEMYDIPCGRRRSSRGVRQARDRTVSELPPAPVVHSGIVSPLPKPVVERCIHFGWSPPGRRFAFLTLRRHVGGPVILSIRVRSNRALSVAV